MWLPGRRHPLLLAGIGGIGAIIHAHLLEAALIGFQTAQKILKVAGIL
jgi:hypothetical protein